MRPSAFGLDHAELDGLLPWHGDGGHGDFGALLLMEFDHVADVHPVDVIGPEDGDDVRIGDCSIRLMF